MPPLFAVPILGPKPVPFVPKRPSGNCTYPIIRKSTIGIHGNTQWKTFKHCCGAVEPFINALIEAEFDILNPVQCSAAGMDPNFSNRNTATGSSSGVAG